MTRSHAILITALATISAIAFAPDTKAETMLRYTWGDASAFTSNQNYLGPQTYTQTFSVTGLVGTFDGFQVYVSIRRNQTQVWEPFFLPNWDTPLPHSDCLDSGPRFTVQAGGAGAASASVTNLSALTGNYGGPQGSAKVAVVLIQGTFDPPLVADPTVRYGLATLSYDLSNASGPTGVTGKCGGADLPFCFLVGQPTVHRFNGNDESFAIGDSPALSWQNASGSLNCAMATPASPASWGKLKLLYR